MTGTAKVVVDTVLAVVRLRTPEAREVRLDSMFREAEGKSVHGFSRGRSTFFLTSARAWAALRPRAREVGRARRGPAVTRGH